MTNIINLEQIRAALRHVDLIAEIEAGFSAYSRGDVVVPPVGELCFEEPRGDVHIKYGYIKQDDFYVIKIASGFYENPKLGLSSSQGLMLVFCQRTGVLKAVLLDEGFLTDVRTAVAGAVVAKYMAPKKVHCIGLVGAGIQARFQLQYLRDVVACERVLVWTNNMQRQRTFLDQFGQESIAIRFTDDVREIANTCNLIVTATPATEPLIEASDLNPGTHITAVGSDTPEKQELDSAILVQADCVIADSISQCQSRGEIFKALEAGTFQLDRVHELGRLIQAGEGRREHDGQVTVADLTGVAVQDIQIAKAVYRQFQRTLGSD